MELLPETLEVIKAYTLAEFPKELCGVILQTGEFVKLENCSETPEKEFRCNPTEFAKNIGQTVAVIHSHCQNANVRQTFDLRTPSIADLRSQHYSGVPWGIVGTEGSTFLPPVWLPRTPSPDFLGRRFIPYITDCYTLAWDYHYFIFGRELPAYSETWLGPEPFDWCNDGGQNHFKAFLDHPKFRQIKRIEDLQNGDLLITNFRGRECSHIAIYDNGECLHQDLLSTRSPLSDFVWNIQRILRYAD
jgi:cell wall-associated NlpC family hydrolase